MDYVEFDPRRYAPDLPASEARPICEVNRSDAAASDRPDPVGDLVRHCSKITFPFSSTTSAAVTLCNSTRRGISPS